MSHITMAMNRAAYRAALDDVSGDLEKVADAIASCEADLADQEARLRVLHVKRDHLAETRERYEAFLASTSDHEAGCRH